MRLLIDTHVFLWYIIGDSRIPSRFRAEIQDPTNEVFISVASIWKAVVKSSLGKLTLPGPPARYLTLQKDAHGMVSLPIDEGAMHHLETLPLFHRDPFDGILIAQAMQHGLSIATVDPCFIAYPIHQLSSS